MISYSIGTNFDSKLIKKIDGLNAKCFDSRVVEVYGSLPAGSVGSGRVCNSLPQISKVDIGKHIDIVHSYGLKFNYLVNAFCGDKDLSGDFAEEVCGLYDLGIDSITLADNKLIELARKIFPDLDVNVSLIRGVENVEDAKRYSDMGVKSVYLNQHSVNRDGRTIERVVEAVDCDVRLYANVSCLDRCPVRKQHYDYVSGRASGKRDPFLGWCIERYLENPVELLKSPFIRPENIGNYVDLGVSHFKLSDRREPTAALVNVVESYLSGKLSSVFEGNLFRMLFRDGRKWTQAYGSEGMGEVGLPDVYIDNDVLTREGFGEKVLDLRGGELKKFYEGLTGLAVGLKGGGLFRPGRGFV